MRFAFLKKIYILPLPVAYTHASTLVLDIAYVIKTAFMFNNFHLFISSGLETRFETLSSNTKLTN